MFSSISIMFVVPVLQVPFSHRPTPYTYISDTNTDTVQTMDTVIVNGHLG